MDLGLKGKVALVAASSKGLGKAIATELAKEGANLILCSRDKDKIEAVAKEIRDQYSTEVLPIQADLTDPAQIESLVKQSVDHFGKIHILVNNAGGPPSGPFIQLTDEDWQRAFETNFMSQVRLIRAVFPIMREQGGGRIASISSSGVKQPIPNLILSNSIRLGVVGLMKSLSIELAPHGILVNTVCPGRIATDRVDELDQNQALREGISIDEVREILKARIPLKRYGQPEEFARMVAFLVSEANSYITGTVQFIDGGMTQAN